MIIHKHHTITKPKKNINPQNPKKEKKPKKGFFLMEILKYHKKN
jgi:hypothetical protein